MSQLTETIKASVWGGNVNNALATEQYKILALVAIAEAIERGASNATATSGASGSSDGERTFGGGQ